MSDERLNIDLKGAGPFRLGQYVLRLLDIVRGLRRENRLLSRELDRLKRENEDLKKNFP